MKETKIYADEFCTTFASTTEMLEFLAERAKQSKWIRKPTRMLKLVPLEKEAETIEEACEKELEGIVEDTEKNTQLVLKVNKDFYPVRDCAIHTILKRAGINGTGLKKLEKATYAKVVNYCLQVAKGDALIKVADGKVSAVHGGDDHDYCVLDMQTILNTSTILVIQFIGTVIIWVVGAQEVFKENMTIGTIMALMNYQTIIMNPIIGIAQFANEYHTAVVSLKDINGLLQYPDQKQGDGEEVTTVNNISLEEMSFSYTESNKKVFDRLNLKFEKGTLYGVHGKSGQGKSTLFKIITGVYQPTKGKVVVNNTDLQELDINSYWKNTGYVMQRTLFFNDTVRRNMGLLHIVSEEEMDTVAKCLDLYDEIHTLEMVWDTEIKIDPCNFSEGQMRRLDIMRNILKNSQILIFDEATANIDEKRRGRFYQLLHELSGDKIIIFSTHNLEELREADIIVDLEKMHIRQVSEK